MNNYKVYILSGFIIILLLIVIIYPQKIVALTWSKGYYLGSNLDNNNYRVISYFTDPNTAANKLAKINHFNESLISYLNHKCNSGECNARQESIRDNLIHRYSSESLIENDPPTSVNTSYTQFKGKVLAICLREKETGQNNFENDDTLKFVDLHELGHVSSNSFGHNNEFWNNFRTLLHIAEEANMYTPINYSEHPLRYCGVDVHQNPYYWD